MSLRAEGLVVRFADREVLSGLDLDAAAGHITAVLGPSGSGKTTLLRCLAGLQAHEAGRVLLDGDDITDVPAHKRGIGMMFQQPALFPHMDVASNVAFGVAGDRAGRRAEALAWLGRVGLEDRAGDKPLILSGGEQQRVALARTLAARPRAVLLDEPLSALDAALRVELGAHVRRHLVEAGIPVVWVTHDESEAGRLADSIVRL